MCTNMVSELPAYKAQKIPKWQEAAQSLMAKHTACLDTSSAGRTKGFQHRVISASSACDPKKMVPKYLKEIGLTAADAQVYTVSSADVAKATTFFSAPPTGEKFLYNMDMKKASKNEPVGHAISVRSWKKTGAHYEVVTYNQGNQKTTTWTVDPVKNSCKSSTGRSQCDTLKCYDVTL